jgi:2-polyprenyl-3-methyl-5-hydroxy-6-metoxy-1,4-benzoquinol methylase
MFLKTRIDKPELMDTVTLSDAEMRQTLRYLARGNRQWGGSGMVISYLEKWTAGQPAGSAITILDVGTGAADIPIEIAKWARQKNLNVQITGVDIVPEIIAIAKEETAAYPEIEIKSIDINDLAAAGKKFDYVIGSLFLHHVSHPQQIPILKTFDKLARRGLLISDLHRSYLGFIAVAASTFLFGNRITRHDGPLSVRRAFTVEELNAMAKEAGLAYLKADTEPWFRISLSGVKHG